MALMPQAMAEEVLLFVLILAWMPAMKLFCGERTAVLNCSSNRTRGVPDMPLTGAFLPALSPT